MHTKMRYTGLDKWEMRRYEGTKERPLYLKGYIFVHYKGYTIHYTLMRDRSSQLGEQRGPNFLHRRGSAMTVMS